MVLSQHISRPMYKINKCSGCGRPINKESKKCRMCQDKSKGKRKA